MKNDPQWTIQDLIMRYDLEPDLQDIFVEGAFDQDVLQTCLSHVKDHSRVCYPIDLVCISDQVLSHYELTRGNKQKAIALAMELSNELENFACKCLVDSDLDNWINPQLFSTNLVRTKYTSLDMYFFSEGFIKHLLVVFGKAKIMEWENFFLSFVSVLKIFYAFRLADKQLNLSVKWIPIEKCLKKQNGVIEFDGSEYVNRLLLANSHGKFLNEFSSCYLEWLKEIDIDPRLCVRGHDFIDLVAWTIKKFNGKRELATPEVIESAFLLVAEKATEILKEV